MNELNEVKLATEHYTAQAVIVWCYDHRAWEALQDFIKSRGIADFDLVSVAGGIKGLASPAQEFEKEFLLNQLTTSARLHHTQKVILMNHLDCGGYGGSSACGETREKEIEFHRSELEKAAAEVRKILPDLPVEKVLVTFDGTIVE